MRPALAMEDRIRVTLAPLIGHISTADFQNRRVEAPVTFLPTNVAHPRLAFVRSLSCGE
jgi:hypothetical protein